MNSLVILAFFSGWALFACSCSKEKNPTGPRPLRMQLHADPVSLDPALAEDGVGLQILSNIMDGLVGYGPTGELQNRLASDFKVSADGLHLEFTLRPEAKWSDGKPVQAQDFVAGLRRSLDPGMGSKVATLLYPIRGAQAYRQGKGSVQALGVAASPDGKKLMIDLERPTPYFPGVLTVPAAMPVREDALKVGGGKWTDAHPVTGVWRVVTAVPGQKYVLERNPYYSARISGDPEKFPSVELWVVRDESTALNLFENGKLDLLQRIPAYDLPRLKKRGQVVTSPFHATYYLAFNTRKPPFDERHRRRAVAGAIRKQEIVNVLGTGESAARSWIPEGIEGFIPGVADPALFADSIAWSKIHPLPATTSIQAAFDTSGRNALVMEKVQSDLASVLGLKVTLTHMDWKSHVRSIQSDAAAIFRFGWLAPFRDPISHLKVFVSDGENNYTGWSNAEYDKLVRQIDGMKPGALREAEIRRAQQILVEREAVVIPLYHYVQSHLVSSRVGDFRANPFGVVHYGALRMAAP